MLVTMGHGHGSDSPSTYSPVTGWLPPLALSIVYNHLLYFGNDIINACGSH
jgi:hypothetical protein